MKDEKKEILITLCKHAKNTKEAFEAFMAAYPRADKDEVKRTIRHEFYDIPKVERIDLTNLEEREIKSILYAKHVDISFGLGKEKYYVRISKKSRMFPDIHNMVVPIKQHNYENQRGKSMQIISCQNGGSIIEVENEVGERFLFTSFDIDRRIGIIKKYGSTNQ